MKKLFISLLLLSSLTLYAEDSFKFSNAPLHGDEEAVLVLAPGLNDDGSYFLKEEPWLEFAKRNKLGIIAINYKSDEDDIYGEEKKGYYWPDQGSGQALLDEIKRVYGKDFKIVIYGFSAGAQFAGRFIEWTPDRIIAWCAYSAQFWDYSYMGGKTKARGIVACGDADGYRWQPSFAFFYKGRQDGRPWIWVSNSNTGHNRSAKLENFIREFFDFELLIYRNEIHEPHVDIIADISTKDEIPDLTLTEQPALTNVFRTKKLYETWKKIHEQ